MSSSFLRPAAYIAVLGSLALAGPAGAATLSVDDDGADCPAAPYTSVQAAVDAAASGDTIAICAGHYAEGPGTPGTNALTIQKDLVLKGAGADLVTISPKASSFAGGQILEGGTADIRNGVGDVVAVVGSPTIPLTVDISGVTVDGFAPGDKPVAVEAGVLFLDAKGSVKRSRVTNTVTSEGVTAFEKAGGYRGAQPGIGIVQTSAARLAPVDGTRDLDIELTRVDKYNKVGILIDGAQNDAPPLVASGTVNRGRIAGSTIVGRTQCINFAGTGQCTAAVVGPITDGPLFGQDGLRVTAGARALVTGSLISQNLVNGTGAPIRQSLPPASNTTPPPNTGTTGVENLPRGAGIRLIGAYMTTAPVSAGLDRTYNTAVGQSNIVDNAYGAINLLADGTTNSSAATNVFLAENNWWGLRIINGTPNPGPAIGPTLVNPPFPENPVNGTGTTDVVKTATGATTSNAVDFQPYRNGVQSDSDAGEFTLAQAPMPVDDAAPTNVAVVASAASVPRGGTVTLTAAGADDFGVKRVRIYDGATKVADFGGKAPYATTVPVPASAACGSSKTYTALVSDSIDQSTSSLTSAASTSRSATVTVACDATTPPTTTPPTTTPTPAGPAGPVGGFAAPTLKFVTTPTSLKTGSTIAFTPVAAAGVDNVQVRLGSTLVCVLKAAPYSCRVEPRASQVGRQALVATVFDKAGGTASVAANVQVAKFKPTISLRITRSAARAGKVPRKISGTLRLPAGITRAEACKTGEVAIVVKRAGRTVLNQQIGLTKACTFTKSVIASKANQRFTVTTRFGGNTVLATATTKSRRFS